MSETGALLVKLTNQVAALTEENARLREDAERYRWLREQGHKPVCELYVGVDSVRHPSMWALSGSGADAAIDAARKESGNG